MTGADFHGIPIAMAKIKTGKTGKDLLLDYVRDQRKPNVAPPGFVFVLSAFARALGCSRQQLRWWTIGATKPSAEHRARLASVTAGRVPASSWD